MDGKEIDLHDQLSNIKSRITALENTLKTPHTDDLPFSWDIAIGKPVQHIKIRGHSVENLLDNVKLFLEQAVLDPKLKSFIL
jgi:hypothetical protein